MHFIKSRSREKLTQDEKVYFFKGNELKITHVELLPFFIFKCVTFWGSVYSAFSSRKEEKIHQIMMQPIYSAISKPNFQICE